MSFLENLKSLRAHILEYTTVFPIPNMLHWNVILVKKGMRNTQFMGDESKPIYFCIQ